MVSMDKLRLTGYKSIGFCFVVVVVHVFFFVFVFVFLVFYLDRNGT